MSCASPPSPPTADPGPLAAATPLDRRLAAEWDLLHRLAARNPNRLTRLHADDLRFDLRLSETPAFPIPGNGATGGEHPVLEHEVTLIFPRYFPSAPLECYLGTPMQHPNIHPLTGFVCLWDRHRGSHTVEHALHKLVAILGWKLHNPQPIHVMQPEALARIKQTHAAEIAPLAAPPLLGILHSPSLLADSQPRPHRRRLS